MIISSSMNMEPIAYMKKNLKTTLVLLGNVAVGKSSIVRRRTKGIFDCYSESTIGAAFASYSKTYFDRIVRFEIWDTAGQERYRSITPLYYRNATSVFLVYDITDKATFLRAKEYLDELKKHNSGTPVIVLVGNKLDLEHKRKVTKSEALIFTEQNSIYHCEVSAKSGQNIDKLFEIVAKNLPEKQPESDSKIVISSSDDENISPTCCGIF